MADPLSYQPIPPTIGPTAREELERLLESAHRSGLLRVAIDLATSRQELAAIIVNGLNTEGSRTALQNLATLLLALAQIPPARFYKITNTVKDAVLAATREPAAERGPPGVRGLYRALQDEKVWRAMEPLIAAITVLGEGLRTPVPEKPISAMTGKPSDA